MQPNRPKKERDGEHYASMKIPAPVKKILKYFTKGRAGRSAAFGSPVVLNSLLRLSMCLAPGGLQLGSKKSPEGAADDPW